MRTVKGLLAKGAVSLLRTSFARSGERRFFGFVVDPSDLDRRFTVEITVDGDPVSVVRADTYVHHLAQEPIGDGCYGFSVSLDTRVLSNGTLVGAQLANVGTTVGQPIPLNGKSDRAPPPEGPGAVRWLGALRFRGWVSKNQDVAAMTALVDGVLTDRIRLTGWSHIGAGDDIRAVRSFDLQLPVRFADGNVHELAIVTNSGEQLSGSPIVFLAFDDGLRGLVAADEEYGRESLRAELFDQLLPASLPFTQYAQWRDRFPVVADEIARVRAAVVLVGGGATDDTLESLRRQAQADWVAVALSPGRGPTDFEPEPVQRFLDGDGAGCAFVVFGLAGTVLERNALQRLAYAFSAFDTTLAAYGDLDIRNEDRSLWPLALPAFDYERMLAQGYCANLFALPTIMAQRCLAAGAADLYRLFNAILDDSKVSSAKIVHLPGSLGILPMFDRAAANEILSAATRAHLKRRGVAATTRPAEGNILPAVRVKRTSEARNITIIVPTRDRHELLEACLSSIRPALEQRNSEIIVIDNGSTNPDTLRYLAKIDRGLARVMQAPGPFNFARLNNCAVQTANGEILCLLNNDVKALDDEWLEEMLSRISEPDVGAVGALLIWPSGVVQHGGVVLGTNFAAAHSFNDRVDGDPGYCDLLRVAHECSAVTAACLVTRREDYIAVGGLDEVQFPVNFNDVDYCLKLRARGQRIVFTPHAKLMHLESASRGADLSTDQKARFERELQNLRAKWGSVLAADPYYSPLLARDPMPFSALAWPPGSMEPRVNGRPIAVTVPAGF